MNRQWRCEVRDIGFIAALVTSSVFGARAETIAGLTSRADVIVVGAATTVISGPQRVSFDLSVDRVVKGSNVPAIFHIEHDWIRRGMFIGNEGVPFTSPLMYGVWFLLRSTSGWDVICATGADGDLFHLFLPASRTLPAAYQGVPQSQAADRVTVEVGAGIRSTGESSFLVSAMHGLNGPAVEAILSDLLVSGNKTTQANALAALLERGLPSSVEHLAQMWPSIGDGQGRAEVRDAVRDSFRGQDPASIDQMVKLVQTTPSSDLKAALISALAAIHTRETLPFLASLLQSEDMNDRVKGIFGLSSFANNCPSQTPDNVKSMAYLQPPATGPYQTTETLANFAFRQGSDEQEAKLVAFWSAWWNDHTELH